MGNDPRVDPAARAAAQSRRSGARRVLRGLGVLRTNRYDSEVAGVNRQNLFSDAWDGEDEEEGTRHRIFWRPTTPGMGATLCE
jgi:hypothetical protein